VFKSLPIVVVAIAVSLFVSPLIVTAQSDSYGGDSKLNHDLFNSLPVMLHPQETDNWCWAACGQMIMEYLGIKVSQCEQANNRYRHTDCCNSDSSSAAGNLLRGDYTNFNSDCAQPGWPEFEKYGFTYKRRSKAPLTWKELKIQLSDGPNGKGKPFAFSWQWNKGGGHMMIAKGFATIDGENYVIIIDPWPPNLGDEVIITYSAFVDMMGSYTHWDDFFDISNITLN
jgi:hypothetical protein